MIIPRIDNVQDIPARLRALADQIERGSMGPVHQLAWVISDGTPRAEPIVGLLGSAAHTGAELHLLLARGMAVISSHG